MNEFLKKYFPTTSNLKKEKLKGDGGHRKYFRIKTEHQSFILMSCGENDPSLKEFIDIQKRLEPYVFIPQIFQQDIKKGLLLLEDLGDQSLEQFFFQKGEKQSLSFYHQALKQLILLQHKVQPLKQDSLFNKDFFLKENERAIHHLQVYLNTLSRKKRFDNQSSTHFKKDMQKLLNHFKKEDYVFCHRDYHSRNLMIKKGNVVMIDFQDAGLGPWYYDLTSLLYDSYVPLTLETKKNLIDFYFQALPLTFKNKARSPSYIEFMIKIQFLQRGFKACGCFASFKNLNQKPNHLKYILPSLKILEEEAFQLSYLGIYKYIKQMTELLSARLSEASKKT